MPNITAEVRQAALDDAPRLRRLLDEATRQYISLGREDLQYVLTRGRVWLADADPGIWGFVAALPRQAYVADLRALVLTNGWRVDVGIKTLLGPAVEDLRAEGTESLVCLGTAAWLVPPLHRAGFEPVDRIVFFERAATTVASPRHTRVTLRPVRGGDLPDLLDIDGRAFEWLWRFDRGHFMELLVTRGHLAMALLDGQPVGYAISDVVADLGFVVRLAVHPEVQGQGVGGDLLADALSYCYASGAVRVRLNTQESNAASHRLYERFGFLPVGRRVPVLVKQL